MASSEEYSDWEASDVEENLGREEEKRDPLEVMPEEEAEEFDEASLVREVVDSYITRPSNLASASELTEQALVAIDHFKNADVDRSNCLSLEEVRRLSDVMGLSVTPDEESFISQLDSNGNGSLDLREWIQFWLQRISSSPNPVKQQLAIAIYTFNRLDRDQSGALDVKEFQSLLRQLGVRLNREELRQAIDELDIDGSGVIDREEFIQWWQQRSLTNRSNVSVVSLKLKRLAAKAAQLFHTDIHTAAWEGNVDLVKAFIDSERRLVHSMDASEYGEGWQPLHYASYKGHYAVVEALLEGGAPVNGRNSLGFTPVFYAAQMGHLTVVKLLMDHGADPSLYGVQVLTSIASLVPNNANVPSATSGTATTTTNNPTGANLLELEAEKRVFLCAADHIKDTKELKNLFSSHSSCRPPEIFSNTNITLQLKTSTATSGITLQSSVMSPFILYITFPSVSSRFSLLPIQKWRASLYLTSFGNEEKHEGWCNVWRDWKECKSVVYLDACEPTVTQKLAQVLPVKLSQQLNFLLLWAIIRNQVLISMTTNDLLILWKQVRGCLLLMPKKLRLTYINPKTELIDCVNRGPEDSAASTLKRSMYEVLDRTERQSPNGTDPIVWISLAIDQLNGIFQPVAPTKENLSSKLESKDTPQSKELPSKRLNRPPSTVTSDAKHSPVEDELAKFSIVKLRDLNLSLKNMTLPSLKMTLSAVNALHTAEPSEPMDVSLMLPFT